MSKDNTPPSGIAAPTKACPFCAETILAAAIKCRFCGSDLSPEAVSTEFAESHLAGYVPSPLPLTSAAPRVKRCPYCKEQMQHNALVCPHCGRNYPITPEQRWGGPLILAGILIGGCVLALALFFLLSPR